MWLDFKIKCFIIRLFVFWLVSYYFNYSLSFFLKVMFIWNIFIKLFSGCEFNLEDKYLNYIKFVFLDK